MGGSDDLREVRDSLTRATTELAAAADRLEVLEAGNVHGATVLTRRWRRRDSMIAALSSIGTAVVITLVGIAIPRTEPIQAIVVTTHPSVPSDRSGLSPAPSLGLTASVVAPPPVVQAPAPVVTAPLLPVRPVAAKKPDAPSEPIRAARPRPESRDFSDVF